MRGGIFDDLMMFIGYYLPIFIIILGGVIFILTSIFKFYHINNPSQYYISMQNQNNQNNQNSNQNTINSTIMVNIYYQNGFNIYYVPSFIENLSNWNISYNITNSYSGVSSNSSIVQINPPNINNTNSTSFDISSSDVGLESTINLSNNTFEGNDVIYTYNETIYNCSIVGNNVLEYQAGSFAYFCILCKSVSGNSPSIQNYYLSEPEYINITPAISLLGNSYPNTQYYNYTVNNVEIVNGTYLAIPLSNNGGYSMEDFQNILVTIGPSLIGYIQNTPYVGDNVVFLVNYDGKYYALPSWYAGEDSNGNYYFFINLLNIPSLYNSNFGCNIISIFVGFSNESLLSYLNGTIGGDPYALDPNNPSNAIIYDNGLNVFPIYVNFYPYNGNVEEQEISCNNEFEACFINNQSSDVLPTYNNISIYLNGTGANIEVVTSGTLQGLVMDNGKNQGSYALITSNVLRNTFNHLSQSQNGLGLQTFAYFSGIPWEDSPSGNPLGTTPYVSAAVVLSYVSYNSQFYADTVSDYNTNDSTTNCRRTSRGCVPVGNQNIGINVGTDTYLPLNFPIFMYEYAWAFNVLGPGPSYSSGYYVGILQNNDTLGLGYFLTTQYTNNPNTNANDQYWDYYYSGSGWSSTGCGFLSSSKSLHYYFKLVSTQGNQGKEFKVCDNSYPLPFIPPDQQNNQNYSQYGVFWLYNWFQAENNNENSNNMNIYFLMNGNIFNYSLASQAYSWNGGSAIAIPPAPPGNISNITGEPIFVQSYINAYNTAFNQPANRQMALYHYSGFTSSDVDANFVPGTFGYEETYNTFYINYLQDDLSVYSGTPYLFISAGSGGGSGFMYLNWIIVTYGVPYVVSVS